MKQLAWLSSFFIAFLAIFSVQNVSAATNKLDREARPPFHLGRIQNFTTPGGLNPQQVRAAYNLTASGAGTIAIVDGYDNPNAAADLQTFSTQFGIPMTGSFTKHTMGSVRANSGWALESSLDVQWAHAIAPAANILLVEAKSSRLSDLLAAVDYARKVPGVISVTMSWGASEFSGSSAYDSYFTSGNGQPITFFASSGDSGTGVQWPAVSANVVGVGGTTLNASGSSSTETAWNGSGGGISSFVNEPSYQSSLVHNSNGMRAVPDVSFDADPQSGVAVYDSYGYNGQKGWFVVGGTSLGSPSWAAIRALGTASNPAFYTDATNPTIYSTDFRDVTSGSNGSCGAVCTAATGYDFITGLGSPLVSSF